MNLTEQLTEKRNNSAKVIPEEIRAIMLRSIENLKAHNVAEKALKTEQNLPSFTLRNIENKTVSLANFNSDFLVISFYRGGWCPYCNIELKALQNIIPELTALNGELIAITPETPDNSLTTSEKNNLTFTVLSDIDNAYAKTLGLVFQLPEDLKAVYSEFGIKVDKHNENNDFELPMPATYIVNKDRKVVCSFVPEDYTERLDPETILEIIKKK
ncbi:peroxiredoxin-like family protein [Polaribacter sp. Hel1_85]|uniref:peroxiredoxin-like family protein n=1 Tax=Polaribacter sp. Hel1_85 TaxID=1250005 RepID=UPI00052C2A7F|nr:peroxiredoxin-like family protein [Polaribacter sp. Hel1_85]KGL64192.1 alkyl hydroperoxide reductase [Polaribacter sp. Hel1_85]